MTFCPHCEGADAIFDQKTAEGDLRDYQQGGAGGTTKQLLDAIKSRGVSGLSLLDIGGGIGVIQHELAAAGVGRVTDVDASRAYLRMAREVNSLRPDASGCTPKVICRTMRSASAVRPVMKPTTE